MDVDYEKILSAIPFVGRSLNLPRDVPKFDQQFVQTTDEYTFIYIRVDPEGSDNDHTLCGFFKPPPQEGDTNVAWYKPQDKDKEIALTGGTDPVDNTKVLDLQFNFVQKTTGTDEVLIMGRGKLYKDSVSKFKVDWDKLGPVLAQHLYGNAMCTLNREKTKQCVYDPAVFFGSVALYIQLHPDLPKIVKACGIKMSLENCIKLAPALADLAHLNGPREESDTTNMDAVNLLRFKGDASQLEGYIATNQVELYVISNMKMECYPEYTDEEGVTQLVPKENETAWLNEMLVLKNFSKKDREIAVFAVPKDKVNLRELLIPYSPQMFPEAKKARVVEEEEE